MRALKVLDEGGVGRFSAFRWPAPANGEPGAWVEDPGTTHMCVRGVHACVPDQLPYWLGQELYVIELDGPVTQVERKVVAPRGRLIGRVDRWDAGGQRAFVTAAALHARDAAVAIVRAEREDALADRLAACTDLSSLGAVLAEAQPGRERSRETLHYVSDAVQFAAASTASSAYCAAHAGLDREGYLEARAFQARWLTAALDLEIALAS
ncbi:MAG: hypothetical protein QM820_09310 [Minicystis sp.]